jgi:hypothetical protein
MTKYLELLLDLLTLEEEEKQAFLAIGEVIAHHTNKKLLIHHRMHVVFQAWFDVLLEKISLEEFLATGDISSQTPLWQQDTTSSLTLLHSPKALEKLEQGSMLLVDEISFLALSKPEQDEIQDILEKKEILLLVC